MMLGADRLSAALLALLFGLGCAEKNERPPPATCVGCINSPVGSGMSPEGGAGPTGEAGGSNADSAVELTGNVLVLNDDLGFATGDTFNGEVELRTESAKGQSATGLWNGVDPFSIKDVAKTTLLWVLATPKTGIADDVLPVLEPVRTDRPDALGQVSVTLALVHGSSMERIFDLASVPLTQDTTKAQIILLLKQRSTGSAEPPPLADTTVKAASAEDVLYGASGGFSDVVTTTDATGVAVLANVPGAAWPGALVSVEFSGAKTGGGQLRAVSGAVTVATLTP